MANNPFKQGDKVKFKDGDPRTFLVYDTYGDTQVSLSLINYPDVEQDGMVSVNRLEKVTKK